MLRCYLVAICQGSSVDAESGQLSLFKTVEQAQASEWPATEPLPFELHAYFEAEDADDLNSEFELRAVWIASDGQTTPYDQFARFTMTRPRVRVRGGPIPLPPGLGKFHIAAEWRHVSAKEWSRSPSAWPFALTLAAVASVPPKAP